MSEDSERGNLTLYINYLNSSTTNNSTAIRFQMVRITCHAIQLLLQDYLGNTTIAPGDSAFATNYC